METVTEAPMLYMLATPIGNLQDISLRALACLRRATVIAAEDTRVARRLLSAHGIAAPRLLSLRAHNEQRAAAQIVDLLRAGQSVVYVTDAGTPAISDPGARLTSTVRDAGFAVSPLPGASALTAFLSVAGLPEGALHFHGFLPSAAAKRKKLLQTLGALDGFSLFYEAPHRITAALDDCATLLGGNRRVVIGRELTKRHEQIINTTLAAAAAAVRSGDIPPRGEWIFALENSSGTEAAAAAESWRVFQYLLPYLPPRRAAAAAAKITAGNARALYQRHLAAASSV